MRPCRRAFCHRRCACCGDLGRLTDTFDGPCAMVYAALDGCGHVCQDTCITAVLLGAAMRHHAPQPVCVFCMQMRFTCQGMRRCKM